jgi:hypothetical protein
LISFNFLIQFFNDIFCHCLGAKERVIPITMASSAGSAAYQPAVEPTKAEKTA